MRLIMNRTCAACPEQYDVLLEDGTMVGYIRLRHGSFTVRAEVMGDLLFERGFYDAGYFGVGEGGVPAGELLPGELELGRVSADGIFERPQDRQFYLDHAAKVIAQNLGSTEDLQVIHRNYGAPDEFFPSMWPRSDDE